MQSLASLRDGARCGSGTQRRRRHGHVRRGLLDEDFMLGERLLLKEEQHRNRHHRAVPVGSGVLVLIQERLAQGFVEAEVPSCRWAREDTRPS